jgi:hypothetical protein
MADIPYAEMPNAECPGLPKGSDLGPDGNAPAGPGGSTRAARAAENEIRSGAANFFFDRSGQR